MGSWYEMSDEDFFVERIDFTNRVKNARFTNQRVILEYVFSVSCFALKD